MTEKPSNDSGAGDVAGQIGDELNAALAALEDLLSKTAKDLGSGAADDLQRYALDVAKDAKRAIGNDKLQKELRAQMRLMEELYRVRFSNAARGVLSGVLDIIERVGLTIIKLGVPVVGRVLGG